jgi:hypothetical protein
METNFDWDSFHVIELKIEDILKSSVPAKRKREIKLDKK